MRINRVKKLWREGQPAVGGWLSIPHCVQAEVMAHTGLDWLCIDMQHGCIDYSDTVPLDPTFDSELQPMGRRDLTLSSRPFSVHLRAPGRGAASVSRRSADTGAPAGRMPG